MCAHRPHQLYVDLVDAVLRATVRAAAEGDLRALRALGFDDASVLLLPELRAIELPRLGRSCLRAHCLDIRLNADCFARLIDLIRAARRDEQIGTELIRLGAPQRLLLRLFGMTSGEYAMQRRLLGLSSTGVGRPPIPNEDAQAALWHAWRATIGLPEKERYLQIGRTTGIPLGSAMPLIGQWEREGLRAPKGHGDTQAPAASAAGSRLTIPR